MGKQRRGCPQNEIWESEMREEEKESGAYLEHDGGKRSTERDAMWNCFVEKERVRAGEVGRLKRLPRERKF
jgi:hypothetical protein